MWGKSKCHDNVQNRCFPFCQYLCFLLCFSSESSVQFLQYCKTTLWARFDSFPTSWQLAPLSLLTSLSNNPEFVQWICWQWYTNRMFRISSVIENILFLCHSISVKIHEQNKILANGSLCKDSHNLGNIYSLCISGRSIQQLKMSSICTVVCLNSVAALSLNITFAVVSKLILSPNSFKMLYCSD